MNQSLLGYVQLAKEFGAFDAKIVYTKTIKTADWVRIKCKFGCKGYNTSHCCPPNTPTSQEMQKVIDCYRTALIVHFKSNVNPGKIIIQLEKAMFKDGYYKAFGLAAGPCGLCKECNLEQCQQPENARPSMEACGIDVYETARVNNFPLEVQKDPSGEINLYGLILIE